MQESVKLIDGFDIRKSYKTKKRETFIPTNKLKKERQKQGKTSS